MSMSWLLLSCTNTDVNVDWDRSDRTRSVRASLEIKGIAGEDTAPAAATPEADAKPAIDAPKMTEEAALTRPSGMPQISEDDARAKSLNYVHEAAIIDGAKQPRFKAGQACSTCAHYQGKAGDEWAGCSIFPGKAVKERVGARYTHQSPASNQHIAARFSLINSNSSAAAAASQSARWCCRNAIP